MLQDDLFGDPSDGRNVVGASSHDATGAPILIGLKVKLDRAIDRERPCCRNISIISAGKGPHAGELRCTDCGQHRGWLSKSTAAWIEHVVTRFGAPTTPIVVRPSTLTKPEEAPPET